MNKKSIFSVFFLFLAISCQQYEVATDFFEKMPEERISNLVMDMSGLTSQKLKAGTGYGSGRDASQIDKILNQIEVIGIQRKMVIKKASLRFEVKDYVKTRQRIGRIVENKEAYITSERETKSEYQLSNSMQIRVIPNHFELLIDSLIGQSRNLDEKSITVENVTEKFVDVKARLKSKKHVENRYLEILKKAQTVKDILEVEQKLGVIREEIETTEGRLKFLTFQVSFSTVDLNFYEHKTVIPKSRIGYLNRLSTSFLNGWRGLNDFVLGLVSIWPFLLIMAGIVYLIYKFIKRIRRKKIPSDL